MNDIELNAVLFYADYLSLKAQSKPVTENCKYFYVFGFPMNSDYTLGLQIMYDQDSKYLQQAKNEYITIRDKFGDGGVKSFVDNICCIKSCGMVDAERMLKNIHQYSTRHERNLAFKRWKQWKNNRKFYHIVSNDGEQQLAECSRYVLQASKDGERSAVHQDGESNDFSVENSVKKSML